MTAFDYEAHDWPLVFSTIDQGPRGTMARIAREIGIDDGLLSRIYKRHCQDPSYNPAQHTWGGSNRVFTKEEEASMVDFLVRDLANAGVAMPEGEIRTAVLAHYQQVHARQTRQHHFSASNGWIYNFKKRNRLSGRVSQKERKGDPNPDEIEAFMREMVFVRSIFPPNRIYNCDETPVRIAPSKCFTTQEIGKPTPAVSRNARTKDVVSAIATIRQDGEKLPLAIIAKGTTPACVRNLNLPVEIIRYYSHSGKANSEICQAHVEKVSEWSNREPCALVWDSYASHHTAEVRDTAFKHKVRLVDVPKNATPTKQPLDWGVFGEVNQRHQASLRREDVLARTPLEAKRRSIILFNTAWTQLKRRNVKKAWLCTM